MNHVYTVIVLIIFAVVVSTSQFVGNPIHCWHPAEFKGWYEKYAEYYCWISNTYVVSFSETLPVDIGERKEREITYYQWVPLILALQAFMFKFPNVVWKLLHPNCGLNLNKIVNMADQTQLANPKGRQDIIDHMASHLDKWLDTERNYSWNRYVAAREKVSKICCIICSKRSGTYLSGLFLFVKILYMANVIGQFFLLNAFMATDYNVFGFEVLKGLSENTPWRDSPRFPRVTFCDFEIRQLQNIQRFTIQCVLPINLFNEKIFIFLWFWFFFIAFVSAYNLLVWCFTIVFKRNRVSFVKKYLKITDQLQNGFDRKLCQRFADSYLREDGVFVLRIVTRNSSDLVTTDLVTAMWRKFQEKQNRRPNNDDGTLRPEEMSPLSNEKQPLPED
ncbi:hypothetical protein DPMN_184840 [Dreissena polymorpha]|uniref:Innexin n=2 Tax=Dreissena polymorpha TaxID=45954 RepID=A0A9D4DL33_DREPO|nr:hypothetical protein DPMN_184840 [Dreissena polymorpha]